MNKISKIVLAYFMINVSIIHSFAAVVSDNDGSAFVTKAEFDSMKKSFVGQIDDYNTSIDNRIDGAIASYLAGIRLSKKEKKSLVVKDWGEYTMMNGYIANEYNYPDINANSAWLCNAVNAQFRKLWFSFAQIDYNNNFTSNRRVLLNNITPAETLDLSNATWAGVAIKAKETWTCSKTFRNDNLTSFGGTSPRHVYFLQFLNFEVDGYYPDLNQYSECWDPRWLYYSPDGWRYYEHYPLKTYTNAAVIEYLTHGGRQFDYQHLGNWNKNTTWECTIKGSSNYFKTSSNNTLRTDGWANVVTKGGSWSASDMAIIPSISSDTWNNNEPIDYTDNKATNPPSANAHTIPTMGLISGRIPASYIYQYDTLYDDQGNTVDRLKLQEGMPLMQVKIDEKVEWEPVFSVCSVDGVDPPPNVKVVLSYKPFKNGIKTCEESETQDKNDYVKVEGYDLGEFPVTNNGKVKIKFEANKKGYIYCKWFPALSDTSSIDSRDWEITLDLNSCNTYVSEVE